MVDVKTKNLFKFLLLRVGVIAGIGYGVIRYLLPNYDLLSLIGLTAVSVAVWRICLSVYRRLILPPKHPKSYGKWAIVTGSTSGIGKSFAEKLALEGMNLLVISRDDKKLKEQQEELKSMNATIQVNYLVHDYTNIEKEYRNQFYKELAEVCRQMDEDGGIGVLVNNVGIANEIPRNLDEFADKEIDDILCCNIFSMIDMTKSVFKLMKAKKNGAIINISSGSGNHPGPFLAVYSATKAFMTQFSRSMHVECWGTGVDFLVVTPFYIVSNLYKRKNGSLIAPLPIKLVEGTFKQLGKKYIWQSHGYWFHGFIGNVSTYYWGTVARYRTMMVNNRARYDERMQQKNTERK